MGACGGDRGQTPPPSRSFQTENRDSPGGTGGMKGNRTADRLGLSSSSPSSPARQQNFMRSGSPAAPSKNRRTWTPFSAAIRSMHPRSSAS